MRIRIYHIFLLLLLITGCLPDPLPIDNVPFTEQTVVVGSQNIPGEFLVISVTENFNALEGGTRGDIDSLLLGLLIDSLELSIEVGGTDYSLTNVQAGLYIGTGIPKILSEFYTLSFTNPFNNQPVEATSQLLPFVGFDTVSVSIEETPFDTLVNVSMRIDDEAGPNWYLVNVQLFGEEYEIDDRPYTQLIEDSSFDGEIYEYEFPVIFRDYEEGDSVFVSMSNISEEYYNFLQLRSDQRFQFLGGLGEPVTYPSNIENGLGYFHLHVPDVRLFLFE